MRSGENITGAMTVMVKIRLWLMLRKYSIYVDSTLDVEEKVSAL